jgi:hypothetical protein
MYLDVGIVRARNSTMVSPRSPDKAAPCVLSLLWCEDVTPATPDRVPRAIVGASEAQGEAPTWTKGASIRRYSGDSVWLGWARTCRAHLSYVEC